MTTLDVSADDLKVFLQEAETLIESLDEQILRLEQEGPTGELVQEIFRVAHTLKGSSGMLGFDEMTGLTHAMEDLLDRVRKGSQPVTESIIDVLLMSLDGLRVLKDNLSSGGDVAVDVDVIVSAIRASADSEHPGTRATATMTLVEAVRASAAVAQRVETAIAGGDAPWHVTVELAPDGEWAAVRCFQLLNELDRFGEVLLSVPAQAEIEAEQVGRRLEVLVAPAGGSDVTTVTAALSAVDDVVAASILPFDPAASAPPPGNRPRPVDAAPDALSAAGHRVEPLQSSVRVDVAQIDALMNMVGELVIDRTRISQLSRLLSERFEDEHVQSLSETASHIEKIVDELHERMMQVRMLPVGLLFSKFPRLVRDLSRSLGKSIRLELEGEDTEIDRSVIEQIKDPLVHLIRNACDHGIEAPEGRIAASKSEMSILRLSATHERGQIVIALSDDGRGIDTARVKAKALERGVISSEKAQRMSASEAAELIFEPGLSTASATTEVSGRGVGMDIVRRDIESLGGRIELDTRPGAGTTIRLRLPLTLATFRGLLVACGQTTYAIPLTYVQETLRVDASDVRSVAGRPVVHLRTRDSVLPMVWLDDALSTHDPGELPARDGGYLVVVRASDSESDRPVAIAVDRLIDQQDIVVKSLSSFLGRTRGIAGASILGDGEVVLIVDVPALIKPTRQNDLMTMSEDSALERIAS